jgi:membrane protein YdbS with pleckstrin-like domain
VAERRAQLEGYITETTRNRKRLAIGLVIAAVVAIVVFMANGTVGAFSLLSVALVGVCGMWIMTAHLQDWRYRIRELDNPGPKVIGGGRRF